MRLGRRRSFERYFARARAQNLLTDDLSPPLAALGLQSHAIGVLHLGLLESDDFCLAEQGVRLIRAYMRSLRKT